MSLDAIYLLVYETLPYMEPTPMQKDVEYLDNKYGGGFFHITETNIFYKKCKYTLLPEDINNLLADQILERKDCELWEIVK